MACAQDIGCANIARPNAAQIAQIEQARHDQSKGNRAQEIGTDPNEAQLDQVKFDHDAFRS